MNNAFSTLEAYVRSLQIQRRFYLAVHKGSSKLTPTLAVTDCNREAAHTRPTQQKGKAIEAHPHERKETYKRGSVASRTALQTTHPPCTLLITPVVGTDPSPPFSNAIHFHTVLHNKLSRPSLPVVSESPAAEDKSPNTPPTRQSDCL